MSKIIHATGKGKHIDIPENYRLLKRDQLLQKGDKWLNVQTYCWKEMPQDCFETTLDEQLFEVVIRHSSHYQSQINSLLEDGDYRVELDENLNPKYVRL